MKSFPSTDRHLKDVEALKHLSVGTEQFEIEWFLGGAWKFLVVVVFVLPVLVWHVPDFIQMYGCITPFAQHGFDKFNDKTTKNYFRSTIQRRLDALRKIVQKRNRIEYLEDLGCQKGKRSVTCGNCNLESHNIKICSSPFSSCVFKPYCSPLHQCSSYVKKIQEQNLCRKIIC